METKYTERFTDKLAASKFEAGQKVFTEMDDELKEVEVVGFTLISTDPEHWVLVDDNCCGRMNVRESDLFLTKIEALNHFYDNRRR